MKRTTWLDSVVLFLLTAVLIAPLFHLDYLNNWPSIESTFISDGRMLSERLPHPGWQPLWYCGTRFDYVYPPALRYGTALISALGGVSAARAYHLCTAIFYAFGIVAVYWLVRVGSGSRIAALLSSAASALVSPSFLLMPIYRYDSAFWVPQRLHVLMEYGEGPHISALAVLPAALALSLLALRGGRPGWLAGAGVGCALTVSNNFYGATALAILFPIAVWSVWVTRPARSVWLRAAAIVALAYALCAFWLTPSYLRVTVADLSLVAQPGNTCSRVAGLLAAAAFAALSWRWANGHPERAWKVFIAGALVFLSVYVIGSFYFGLHIAGEAHRLVPELDLAAILLFFECIREACRRPRLRFAAFAVAAIAFYPAIRYLPHAWSPFPSASRLDEQYQYRIAHWVHEHLPGERVLPAGSVRFWFDAWFDNPQLDGGSAQGVLNRILPTATWQISRGDRGDIAILWLQALGTGAVIVPDKTSFEPYRDYAKPEKFRGLVPVLYDDGHGTAIYGIPRRYPGIGRIVDTAAFASAREVSGGDDVTALSRYVALVEDPRQGPAPVVWNSFEDFDVRARVERGQSVLLQETYDPAWHAYENGKPLTIRAERVMNFMLLNVSPGDHRIELRFETPLENRVGQIVSLLAIAAVLGLAATEFGTHRSFHAA